jgi:UDP-glucose 4-epimerase
MTDNKELEQIFKDMLERTIQDLEEDDFYQKDVKKYPFPLRVNWVLDENISGYQIYEADNYSFKFGEKLENPDFTFIIKETELGKGFLKGELKGRKYYRVAPRLDYRGKFRVQYHKFKGVNKAENEPLTLITWLIIKFDKNRDYNPLTLIHLPIFKKIVKDHIDKEKNFGSYLPINKTLNYENQVLPLKVVKHFIDKATYIVAQKRCGCRVSRDCQQHDHSLGCIYMGTDTKRISFKSEYYRNNISEMTKEEAWNRAVQAYENGLITALGRSFNESQARGVEDETGHFLSICFCCSCCCVNGALVKYGPSEGSSILFPRMKGIEVKVNLDKCIGCGECIKVCAFQARKLVDGKAVIDQERCLGCGRCETACPTGATTIEIDDKKRIEEHIKKIESYVDVT